MKQKTECKAYMWLYYHCIQILGSHLDLKFSIYPAYSCLGVSRCVIPTFGIRARAALSCVRERNVGGYGCNWGVQRQASMHIVAYMYIDSY